MSTIAKVLLSGIEDIIRAIFIPDSDYTVNSLRSFVDELMVKFNFDTEFFETLFTAETPVEDIYVDYTIPGVGDFKFKVFNASVFQTGVVYFRPFIRGFLVLLMALYHIKQLIGFFGYDAGVVAGRGDYIKGEKLKQKE